MQYLNFIFLLIKIIVLSSINFSVQAQNKYDGIYKDSDYGKDLTCLVALGDRVIIKDNNINDSTIPNDFKKSISKTNY